MSTNPTTGARPAHGADSEVGRLRTVMLHRPGDELKRLTPRNNDRLLFDGIPWVARAQDEHDAFAAALRERGVEVLYLIDLLTETLASEDARDHAITTALSSLHLGDTMRGLARPDAARRRTGRAGGPPDRRRAQRRGARRLRSGHLPAALRRLPDRPAAQPAVHPRLVGVGARPGHDHLAGDAGPRARDPADRADLHPAPALRRYADAPRLAQRARRGRRRAAAGARRARRRRRASGRRPPAPSSWPARSSAPGWPTPCSPCRSPRSAPRCTSTPSARWSTSTRS